MSAVPTKAPYAVVVGLGRTGLSCVRYLNARGWRLAVTDNSPRFYRIPAWTIHT